MDHADFEERLERNPLRKTVRELYEVKPLIDTVNPGHIERALHYCSRNGSGTMLLSKYFSLSHIDAVDPDDHLIQIARKNVANNSISFSTSPLNHLAYDDAFFGAVFDLGELHNFPEWRENLNEIARVTKKGGYLFIEDLSLESFEFRLGRYFRLKTKHQYNKMFRINEFCIAVEAAGFQIQEFKRRVPFGLFTYFILVARKW